MDGIFCTRMYQYYCHIFLGAFFTCCSFSRFSDRQLNDTLVTYTAVLLCGHGLTLGSKLKLASTNTEFATVIKLKFSDNGLYDYAIATVDSGAPVSLTNKVKNATSYTTITSQSSYVPLVGSTVCMYGKTGGFGTGKVTAMSASMTYSNYDNITIRNLVKCSWTGTPAYGPGSSGGPVYAGHVFYGTYCGSNSTGGDFWYSPVYDTGFNVRTS